MKIGEFSALTGVPIKTIRYYSDIGLLKPHSIDSDSNYRSYKKEQIVTLNRIISLKDAGFMLSDIKMIIDSQITNDDFIKMLEQNLAQACIEELNCQNRIAHLKAYISHFKTKENEIMNVNVNELKLGVVKPYVVNFCENSAKILTQSDLHNLETPNRYRLPLEINLTAMTDSTNIRLYYGIGELIFNWECCEDELRVHDPLTGEQFGFCGMGAVNTNTPVNICWRLGLDKMIVLVNDEVRLECSDMPYIKAANNCREIYEKIYETVAVGSAWGSCVTITKLDVKQL